MTSEMNCLNSGGGTPDIDTSYLPSSTKANVIASRNMKPIAEGNINLISTTNIFAKAYVALSGTNTDVTAYLYGKSLNQPSGDNVFLSVAYAAQSGNQPSFFVRSNQVYYTIYSTDVAISGVSATDNHMYALSLNASTKKVRFFVDGGFKGELSYSNSGSQVVYGKALTTNDSANGLNFELDYIGVVSECESDNTIIANMQTIMSKMS